LYVQLFLRYPDFYFNALKDKGYGRTNEGGDTEGIDD